MANLHYRRYRNTLILRPLPPRKRSTLALWASRVAAFPPILAVLSVLAYRGGYVDTSALIVLAGIVFAIALVGVVLIAGALHSMWTRGNARRAPDDRRDLPADPDPGAIRRSGIPVAGHATAERRVDRSRPPAAVSF